ncbi:MAG TPA: DNA methyltransferase [Lacunisphaera sp.]|nr:DNA methyltransferase [Lacunisphaera sp.]
MPLIPPNTLPPPTREIICADAIAWMQARGRIEGACAITSLPDVSELGRTLPVWRAWFLDAVRLVVDSVPDDRAALFFQSDIKRDGAWIDKGALVTRAAEDAGARVLFHKVVCRRPPGVLTQGRPGFTHLIAVSRAMKCPDILPIPDVITDAGRSRWVRAMGVRAAAHAVRFARDQAGAELIFDPFCGVGTIPAVANALGLDALGIELSKKRCAQSREQVVNVTELTADIQTCLTTNPH